MYRLCKASQQACEVSSLIAPILQERKPRHGRIPACGHTAGEQWSQNSSPDVWLGGGSQEPVQPLAWQRGGGEASDVSSVLVWFPSSQGCRKLRAL